MPTTSGLESSTSTIKTQFKTNFKPTKEEWKKCACGTSLKNYGARLTKTCTSCQIKKLKEKQKENFINGISPNLKKSQGKLKKLKKKEGGVKKPSRKKLVKELDRVVSIYVRKRAADQNGLARCVSSGALKPWQELQCGHYVKRSCMNLRWDLRNCHPQSVGDNVFKHGNYPSYTKFLLENYGAEWLKKLIADGEKIRKWTDQELLAEIEKYKSLIKTL